MPKVMKPPTDWDENDTDTGAQWYDGPPPVPGLYKGVVKKVYLVIVDSGEKKGDHRFMVLCEITEGKYKGAGVSKWLQRTDQGRPWLHQWLHSMTDGSETQKAGIRKAFKDIGYTVDDPDSKKRMEVLKIGKKFVPVGKEVHFVTKMRQDDPDRAEIARFVVPFDDTDDDEAEEPEDDSPESALEDMEDNGDGDPDFDQLADDEDAEDPWD